MGPKALQSSSILSNADMYEDWHQRSRQQKERLWKRLIPAYAELPELEKQMVRLIAIAYGPVTRAALGAMLKKVEIQNPDGGAWTTVALKPYFERLLAEELFVAFQGKGTSCQAAIVEVSIRDAIAAGEFERLSEAVRQIKSLQQPGKYGPYRFDNQDQFIREIRIALYRGDWEAIERYDRDYEQQNRYRGERLTAARILTWVCTNPFDRDWFAKLPATVYEATIIDISIESFWHLTVADEVFAQLAAGVKEMTPEPSNQTITLLIEQCIFRGHLEDAMGYLNTLERCRHEHNLYKGWLAFLRGENSAAIAQFEEGLHCLQKETRKRKNIFFPSMGGLFFILALLKDGSPQRLQEAASYLGFLRNRSHWLSPCYATLAVVADYCRLGDPNLREFASFYGEPELGDKSSIAHLIEALCIYWLDKQAAQQHWPPVLEALYEKAERAGYYWLAEQFGDLLIRVKLGDRQDEASAELRAELASPDALAEIIRVKDPWETALDALIGLQPQPQEKSAGKPEAKKRLAWFLTWYSSRNWLLQPREQKITASGDWSKGRPIALKRLYGTLEEFDYLTEQDRQVCAQMKRYSSGPYGNTDYRFVPIALKFLVGHPCVFWDDESGTRLEVVAGEPELRVKKGKSQQLTIELVPPLPAERDIVPIKETPTRLKVIVITTEHRRIGSVLGSKNKLRVPVAAKERVLQAIAAVSGIVAVQSDIGGASNLREVPAESKPHFQILPAGEGLKVSARVRPFAGDGPYFLPGKGSATAIAEVAGERVQTHRDLRAEKHRLADVLSACPVLAAQEEDGSEWIVPEPEACLETLLELQDLGEAVAVEWPEGEKLRVSHRADVRNFQLGLTGGRNWFAVDGKLQLDNNLVLDMQQLLELLAQTPGRFLPLGDGQFLALTQAFRKRLEELRVFASKRGKSFGLHPLAAHAIQDFAEEVGELKADKHWRDRVRRLREMEELQPQVPSTLQAELRDYQEEGFCWLARLAYWGVGACLADDMGLGKTLQALALMLTRAPKGPTLVVAPTSVCANWEAEAQKFAPTLNPIAFGSGDRQQLLDRLQPFDMLICSYGLLQQEDVAAMLARVQWETVALDEAQAIKNSTTKRSRAAMALQAEFKLILTGTPIENHLGELWNLFQFINPGLLGSLESFNQRFALPIERDKDKPARDRLKKLVQPFLLRRRKSQVLEELPPRTEIALRVELSAEEMAFYEALRQEAVAKISSSEAAAGERHLQVLAEIMRLRRACCHPRLVDAKVALPSAKLECFGEVLTELLENHHKALVFSQFVDHLQIAREFLDGQNISYQYLDGSTRASDRRKRVSAFQAGEGDVFLISLKAGGTGLNLTAADYVIHLDPWWNPAVEDQASDRAHRIGQQRPVTIYRLVAAGTIEEKIIDLHRHKRDLADSLLAGADVGAKLSTDELLALMGT